MAHFFSLPSCEEEKVDGNSDTEFRSQAPSLSDTGRPMDGGKSTGLDPKEGGNRNRIALRCHYRYFCFYSTANPLSSLLGSCEKLKSWERAKKTRNWPLLVRCNFRWTLQFGANLLGTIFQKWFDVDAAADMGVVVWNCCCWMEKRHWIGAVGGKNDFDSENVTMATG